MEKLAELLRIQLGTRQTRVGEGVSGRGGEAENKIILQLCAQDYQQTLTLSPPHPLVGTATLELAEAPLHEQIRQFARVAVCKGYNHLQLLPLFLLPGVHVREDIPTEVALAQQGLGEAVRLNQRPHVGTHPGLAKLLASQWARVDADAKILLSHGSRRAGGNEPVEAVAGQLGAVAAYWSVQPMLEEQIDILAAAGHKRIGILPYFLFPGGITDAIAQSVASLQAKFPGVQLSLGESIGASSELANLILDLIEQ
jgi:sirohydrochlorin ferrochelatase